VVDPPVIDRALERLGREDPRMVQLIEMRFFAGNVYRVALGHRRYLGRCAAIWTPPVHSHLRPANSSLLPRIPW
jgi:hypothetical protein